MKKFALIWVAILIVLVCMAGMIYAEAKKVDTNNSGVIETSIGGIPELTFKVISLDTVRTILIYSVSILMSLITFVMIKFHSRF